MAPQPGHGRPQQRGHAARQAAHHGLSVHHLANGMQSLAAWPPHLRPDWSEWEHAKHAKHARHKDIRRHFSPNASDVQGWGLALDRPRRLKAQLPGGEGGAAPILWCGMPNISSIARRISSRRKAVKDSRSIVYSSAIYGDLSSSQASPPCEP